MRCARKYCGSRTTVTKLLLHKSMKRTRTYNIICTLGKLASKFLFPHLFIREAIIATCSSRKEHYFLKYVEQKNHYSSSKLWELSLSPFTLAMLYISMSLYLFSKIEIWSASKFIYTLPSILFFKTVAVKNFWVLRMRQKYNFLIIWEAL